MCWRWCAPRLARIGGEVYELSRPEIAELREAPPRGGVSSITMPHKRNPEGSEHLDTLSRLVRAHACLLLEGMDQQHERDGRGWKAEWVSLPEVCELTVTALDLARRVVDGLEVNPERHGPQPVGRGVRTCARSRSWPPCPRCAESMPRKGLMAEIVSHRFGGLAGLGWRPSPPGPDWSRRRSRHGPRDRRPARRRPWSTSCSIARPPPVFEKTTRDADDQPRLELGSWPTPLVRARRLEARLGCGPLLIKRDDLSGFAVAGSKARPLEYLLGGAMADGHDALVVGGVATSNFCQAAAVAARAAGLGCHIVLPGHPPPPAGREPRDGAGLRGAGVLQRRAHVSSSTSGSGNERRN